MKNILFPILTLLSTLPTLAYDPGSANRSPSPDMYRPDISRVIIQGLGSPGDPPGMSATIPNGVARTHAARASDRISILDYGGVGDFNGISGTDNLAAWNKAVATGKCVLFPAGQYLFSATPPTVSNKTMCALGEGPEASVAVFSATATDGFVADQANYSQQVRFENLTIAALGNETGSAIKASWSDADATLNGNQRRLTLRNILIRGETNQSKGWKNGAELKNAQNFYINGYTFVGRIKNNAATMADTSYATDAIKITTGIYPTVAGHITSLHVYGAQNCINLVNATTSIEGLNVSQFDCVGVNRGIYFNPGAASPGFVATNGHINAHICGVCGKLAVDATLSNILIYKAPTAVRTDTYCIDLSTSSYSVITGITCKNQAPNVKVSGNMYGIRLVDTNYAQLNNNIFVAPTTGVVLSGSSSQNFGVSNVTAGGVTNGVTSAVIDTSGTSSNTIGTGNLSRSDANAGIVAVATTGTPVMASPAAGSVTVYAGQRYRVTATLSITNGAAAGEALFFVNVAPGSTATVVFTKSATQLVERRAIAASAIQAMTVTGIMTVTGTGTLQLFGYGQTTGATGSVAAGGGQIQVEQL